jgi:uncharacterized membrane protein YhaH (DUF805 family)
MAEAWYTRNPQTAVEKGPFEPQHILQAFKAGDLGRNVEVRHAQQTDWIRLVDHPEFSAPSSDRQAVSASSEAPERRRRPTRVDLNNPYAAFADDDDDDARPTRGTTWWQILFSLQGRIPRRLYWGTRALAVFPWLLAGMLGGGSQQRAGVLLIITAYVVSLWIILAGSVKRWHDLNKSGFWILITMVPCIGGLWEFIEAGCTRGTRGPNRYGEDPT